MPLLNPRRHVRPKPRQCVFASFYSVDPETKECRPSLRVSCDAPDPQRAGGGLSFNAWECRRCGGRGIIDNGCGN